MRIVRWLGFFLSVFFVFQFISLYLSWQKQAVLGTIVVVTAIVMNRVSRSIVVTISLMLLSIAATLRYGWWRINQLIEYFSNEANDIFRIDSVLMLLLLSAEIYTILIMVLGYIQTVRPLRRRPVPLPFDERQWPHVDLLIPTYNEPLSLVRYTALAAINMDYPPDKLHVYILDDGTREEYRQFCEEAGIGYRIREKHNHAKAGNINTALQTMDSPLVSIFDCDHVPTRSFLQMTVGWFLADENLAMLQTPHHFYSADPFERNLRQYKSIPNEGELFYGIIQDGNDLWNATFFCGSCAVIRRVALDQVGGIATETVTEDAHTSLRLQKLGWSTAYINIAMAAGLATETLAAHVGQRIRWARGMIQILRTDNPLLAKGMGWTQRFCYFNAMAHFMYAVPRLIFLLAPLAYMIFNRTIIPGYWVAILAYALPHLIISSLTNSRVQGEHRHSFWNEIYETVLAPYILMPTTLALLNPKLGKFNVTDKGSTLMETRFDTSISAPTSWFLLLNVVGLALAPYRYFVTDPTHPGTIISNCVWILFNIVILGVAAAVAHEQKQRRTAVRVEAVIAMRMKLPDGTEISGRTEDMSVGGASVMIEGDLIPAKGLNVDMSFPLQTKDRLVKAKILAVRGNEVRLSFAHPTILEQETIARVLYSRANSWINTERVVEVDRPLISLARVIRLSITGLYQVTRGLLAKGTSTKAAAVLLLGMLAVQALGQNFSPPNVGDTPQTFAPPRIGNEPEPASRRSRTAGPARRSAAPMERPSAPAQRAQTRQTAPATTVTPAPVAPAQVYAPVQTAPQVASPTATSALLPEAVPSSLPLIMTGGAEPFRVTFKEMGVDGAIELRGPHSFYPLGFTLPYTLVAKQAVLKLSYKFARGSIQKPGSLRVSLNNTTIGDVPVIAASNGYGYAEIALPSEQLIRSNGLTFEYTGSGVLQTEAQVKTQVQGWIGASSIIEISGDRIPFKNDVSLLPMPFLDHDLQAVTTIPFAFLSTPGIRTLQAAGVVASWFGTLVGPQPIRYSVQVGQIPAGNVVVFADSTTKLPEGLRPPGGGPTYSVKPNPSDPTGSVLIISGEGEDQLLAAAQALALRKGELPARAMEALSSEGDTKPVTDIVLPAPRGVNDAPRWMPTDHLVSLTDYTSKDALTTDGSHPVPVYLHLPPDIFYGELQNLHMLVTYKYNASTVAAGSALRVYVNGTLVNEAPLLPGNGEVERRRQVLVPVAAMRPFGNTLLFNFDFIPTRQGAATKGEILRNSALDVRGQAHYAAMPDLELFANAGFPFTRRADLAETTVVMPAAPTAGEVSLFLHMMSHFGSQTGYPALRVQVSGPDTVLGKDRDYLLLGAADNQPAFNSLGDAVPVTFDGQNIRVTQSVGKLASIKDGWERLLGRIVTRTEPSDRYGVPDAMIEGIESPASPGRSLVLISLRREGSSDNFADVFLERSQSSDIGSSVSLLQNGKFRSYGMNNRVYHVGIVSPYRVMRIWFAQYFWSLVIILLSFSLLMGLWLRDKIERIVAKRLEPGLNMIRSMQQQSSAGR